MVHSSCFVAQVAVLSNGALPQGKGNVFLNYALLNLVHYVCGSAHANSTLPLLVSKYWRPSSSYVIGELWMREPEPACQSVLPSLESNARKFPRASPVKVSPESVVKTPAPDPSG